MISKLPIAGKHLRYPLTLTRGGNPSELARHAGGATGSGGDARAGEEGPRVG